MIFKVKEIKNVLTATSCTGCILIFIISYWQKAYKGFHFKLALGLVFSSFLSTLTFLLSDMNEYDVYWISPKEEFNCKLQGFLFSWFENSQYIFSALIGISAFKNVSNYEDDESVSFVKKTFFNGILSTFYNQFIAVV
jgi:hypothetical protein